MARPGRVRQAELGLRASGTQAPRIQPGQLEEMRAHLDDIDFSRAEILERKFRHDVMAHLHAFGELCPSAKGILHLGATSCYVTDNTDLILIREALTLVRDGLAAVIAALARFARSHRSLATVGFTHFQPAQLTTVGKRACLWCYDLVLPLTCTKWSTAWPHCVSAASRERPARKQASWSFLTAITTRCAGSISSSPRRWASTRFIRLPAKRIRGRLIPRLSTHFPALGSPVKSWAPIFASLPHRQEVDEPFETDQVGSSAMAYKRNPMRSERMCSLGRFVSSLLIMASQTAATQWLERSLDDSAIRRLDLPQAFLGVDALLRLALNINTGLVVHEEVIRRNVAAVLPYLATEPLLMAAVSRGGDRQALHERIRVYSHEVSNALRKTDGKNDLLDRLRQDEGFAGLPFEEVLKEENYFGRAPQQVDEFLQEIVEPLLQRLPVDLAPETRLSV